MAASVVIVYKEWLESRCKYLVPKICDVKYVHNLHVQHFEYMYVTKGHI
jgi:hypothetical protein